MVRNVPVGIYNGEIFIVLVKDGKMTDSFDVIRPVTKEQLSYLRDKWERADDYKYFWKEAVASDATEQSFEDWFDAVWDEEFDETDEEDFAGKDDSFIYYLDEDERKAADAYMESQGVEIGTWESSGCYAPVSACTKDKTFKGWEFVFDNDEARKCAKEYEKRVK